MQGRSLAFINEAEAKITDLDYLKESFGDGQSQAYGGLFLSSAVVVTDSGEVDGTPMAGMTNGKNDFPFFFAGGATIPTFKVDTGGVVTSRKGETVDDAETIVIGGGRMAIGKPSAGDGEKNIFSGNTYSSIADVQSNAATQTNAGAGAGIQDVCSGNRTSGTPTTTNTSSSSTANIIKASGGKYTVTIPKGAFTVTIPEPTTRGTATVNSRTVTITLVNGTITSGSATILSNTSTAASTASLPSAAITCTVASGATLQLKIEQELGYTNGIVGGPITTDGKYYGAVTSVVSIASGWAFTYLSPLCHSQYFGNGFLIQKSNTQYFGVIPSATYGMQFRHGNAVYRLATAGLQYNLNGGTSTFYPVSPVALILRMTYDSGTKTYDVKAKYNPKNKSIKSTTFDANGGVQITHNLGTTNYSVAGSGFGNGTTSQRVYISMYDQQANRCNITIGDDSSINPYNADVIFFQWS